LGAVASKGAPFVDFESTAATGDSTLGAAAAFIG